jgi:hypothetical protein
LSKHADACEIVLSADSAGTADAVEKHSSTAVQPNPKRGNTWRTRFDKAQVRITRLMLAPTRSARIATAASEPALIIALMPGEVNGTEMSVGQERWLAAKQSVELRNTGAADIELLRFDFKTPPVS